MLQNASKEQKYTKSYQLLPIIKENQQILNQSNIIFVLYCQFVAQLESVSYASAAPLRFAVNQQPR